MKMKSLDRVGFIPNYFVIYADKINTHAPTETNPA